MHDLIERLAGAGKGTHLVPVLLVVENGSISIEPIENLNTRLSAMTNNIAENIAPKPPEPIDLPIQGMKEALVSTNVPSTARSPNPHFSLAFKQFCYDAMRDGLSPEQLHAKLVQDQTDFEGDIPRAPCLSTLARWDEAGIVRNKKGKGKRKRSNYDKSLQEKVVQYRLDHPKSSTASVARRFNVSQTSVWRWAKLSQLIKLADVDGGLQFEEVGGVSDREIPKTLEAVAKEDAKANEDQAGKVALDKATVNIVDSVVDEEQAFKEQKDTFLSFVKDDPTLSVGQLRELFDVPIATLSDWMREAKRGAGKGNPSGISPRDKYTNAERRDLSNRFARRVVGGETYAQASEKVGVSRSVLVRWCKNLKISLRRKSLAKKKDTTYGHLQFCLGKPPQDWTKLGDWLMANSTSKEKAVFARQCTEMAGILDGGDVPPKKLFTACYRHWANAEMETQGFRP